jgi:pilus assembly protein Flp/PilA
VLFIVAFKTAAMAASRSKIISPPLARRFGIEDALSDFGWLRSTEFEKYPEGTGMNALLNRLWQEEEGQDLVEYGLLLVLVSLGAVSAMGTLASSISNAFGNASKNLSGS